MKSQKVLSPLCLFYSLELHVLLLIRYKCTVDVTGPVVATIGVHIIRDISCTHIWLNKIFLHIFTTTTNNQNEMFQSWADAEDDIPTPEVIENVDGTKTVISYRLNAKGQRVKITQKIKEVKVKERVHPSIAIRRGWAKYGKEKHTPAGPDTRTTQLGEKVELKLGASWKDMEKKEEEEKLEQQANLVGRNRLKCRTCGGDHFTSKCPFKDTLGAETASASATADATESSKYIPAHLRKDAPSKESRDDSCTLRISQLNTFVNEQMLREELLAKYGPLQRATILYNKETGESRGFAFVTFATEFKAAQALEELNGKGYHSLILRLEWSKRKKT